jgi:hypothetical protein
MKNSKRLDAFVQKNPNYRRVFIHTHLPDGSPVIQWQMARIIIGFADDDGWLYGAYLSRIACGIPSKWAFAGLAHVTAEITHEFWKRYSEIGRCAYDPTHEEYFVNSDDRYVLLGSERECSWCGAVQRKTVRRTVIVEEREDWAAV